VGLKPILRTTTSFSALTLLVGSFDLLKPVPDTTYNVFSRTLNPTQSISRLVHCFTSDDGGPHNRSTVTCQIDKFQPDWTVGMDIGMGPA